MNDCIFCKIASHEIPKDFTYEDDEVMVFPDIHPVKPIHLLVVPKKHIEDFLDLNDMKLAEKILKVGQDMIHKEKLENRGYRVLINGGGAQIINHLHFHILGPLGKAAQISS